MNIHSECMFWWDAFVFDIYIMLVGCASMGPISADWMMMVMVMMIFTLQRRHSLTVNISAKHNIVCETMYSSNVHLRSLIQYAATESLRLNLQHTHRIFFSTKSFASNIQTSYLISDKFSLHKYF